MVMEGNSKFAELHDQVGYMSVEDCNKAGRHAAVVEVQAPHVSSFCSVSTSSVSEQVSSDIQRQLHLGNRVHKLCRGTESRQLLASMGRARCFGLGKTGRAVAVMCVCDFGFAFLLHHFLYPRIFSSTCHTCPGWTFADLSLETQKEGFK